MTITDLDKRNEAARLWEAIDGADDEDAAHEAYEACGLSLMVGGEGVERCFVTGAPLLVSDDVVLVLKSALPANVEKAA